MFAVDKPSGDPGIRLGALPQSGKALIRMSLIDEHKHSYAAIEGPRQFQRGDIAGFGEPFEKWWQRPAAAIQFKRNFVAVDTRRVLDKPAAGHMADPRNAAGHARGLRGPVVNPGRLHEHGAKRFGHAVDSGGEVRLRNLDNFPDERKPVGVDAGRRQRDCHVARRRHVARKQGAAFGGTDRKTRKVESAIRINAGHFGRFTANKCGLAFDAPVGDARDHFARQRAVQSAGGKIVQEQQRFGARPG